MKTKTGDWRQTFKVLKSPIVASLLSFLLGFTIAQLLPPFALDDLF